MTKNGLGPDRPQIRLCPGLPYALDFAHALANHRPELKLGKTLSVNQGRVLR